MAQPQDLNALVQRNFRLFISRIPDASWMCNEVELPTFSGEAITINNPAGVEMKFANMNGKYGEFNVNFIVDDNLNNYKIIKEWMDTIYDQHENKGDFLGIVSTPFMTWASFTSDGRLAVYNNKQELANEIILYDLFPIALTGLSFSNTNEQQLTSITATITFAIRKYDIGSIT